MYRGRDDGAITDVLLSLKHYVHDIASKKEDTLEFVSSEAARWHTYKMNYDINSIATARNCPSRLAFGFTS